MGILDDMAKNADKELDKMNEKTQQEAADNKAKAKEEVGPSGDAPQPQP